MEDEEIQDLKAKLLDINKTIEKLDPAIRAAAFEIMAPYYFTDQSSPSSTPKKTAPTKESAEKSAEVDTSSLESFLENYEHDKPKDNVMLLAAWLYSQYGAYPIHAKEIKELSDACGLVVPNRSDNTMRSAKDKGKNLFNQQGKGWKLTVSGELYLKNTYGVKKGNKSVPSE